MAINGNALSLLAVFYTSITVLFLVMLVWPMKYFLRFLRHVVDDDILPLKALLMGVLLSLPRGHC